MRVMHMQDAYANIPVALKKVLALFLVCHLLPIGVRIVHVVHPLLIHHVFRLFTRHGVAAVSPLLLVARLARCLLRFPLAIACLAIRAALLSTPRFCLRFGFRAAVRIVALAVFGAAGHCTAYAVLVLALVHAHILLHILLVVLLRLLWHCETLLCTSLTSSLR